MKTKDELAKDLKISRKTLYNYINELDIHEINENTIKTLQEHAKLKNKSKDTTKAELLRRIDELTLKNAELLKQNETLEKGQTALLEQVEYFRNSIDTEIREIKKNMTLLLNPPKEEPKKSFFDWLFKQLLSSSGESATRPEDDSEQSQVCVCQ